MKTNIGGIEFKVSCKLSSAGMEHFQRMRSGAAILSSLGAYSSLINFLRAATVRSLFTSTSTMCSSGLSSGQTRHISLNFSPDIAEWNSVKSRGRLTAVQGRNRCGRKTSWRLSIVLVIVIFVDPVEETGPPARAHS